MIAKKSIQERRDSEGLPHVSVQPSPAETLPETAESSNGQSKMEVAIGCERGEGGISDHTENNYYYWEFYG